MTSGCLKRDTVMESRAAICCFVALLTIGLTNGCATIDIEPFLKYTNRVCLIDNGVESVWLDQFLKHLHSIENITLIKFNTSLEKDEAFTDRQIIFNMFDSYEALNQSLKQSESSIFKWSPRSLFVVILTKFNHTEEDFKRLFRIAFERIWIQYKILEVFVYLPIACNNNIILKFDPICEDPSKRVIKISGVHLHKYKDFRKYPLEVKMFGRLPTSVKNMTEAFMDTYLKEDIAMTGNVGGIDGFTLANMVKYLNFSVRISESDDGMEYGSKLSNGTFTGTIGDVIARRADISFNSRFLKIYDTDNIEFTRPITYDKFCVLVPKALRIPMWRNIFMGFSLGSWCTIFITACVTGVIWSVVKTKTTLERTSDRSLSHCTSFMDMCLLLASRPILLPSIGRERIFIAGCLFFNLIFSGVFQGYLNTAFSTVSHFPDINTLKALDESGLPIASSSNLNDIFGSGSLQNKLISITTPAIDEAAYKRDVSAVERWEDAHLLIELKYIDNKGEPLLHVVEECPRSYHFSYIVYKGYPFLPQVNKFIQNVMEAGLSNLWYDITVYSIILQHRYQHQIDGEGLKKLTMVDVQTAFFALGIGLIMSTIVFICEKTYFIKNRKPMVDIKFLDMSV